MIYLFKNCGLEFVVQDVSLEEACIQMPDLWQGSPDVEDEIDELGYEEWQRQTVEHWKPKGREIDRGLAVQYFEWKLDGNNSITISLR